MRWQVLDLDRSLLKINIASRAAMHTRRPRWVTDGGAGRINRPSASPSIAGILLHCREQRVGAHKRSSTPHDAYINRLPRYVIALIFVTLDF
jgi:hypothetical protein